MSQASHPIAPPALGSAIGNIYLAKNWFSTLSRAPVAVGMAVFCVAIATGFRWAAHLVFDGTLLVYATFYPAILFAAFFGGLSAGLLALLIGGIVGLYAFVPPTFSLSTVSTNDVVNVALYYISGATILAAIYGYKHISKALARKSEEFQTLADNIPVLCWMADARGKTYWRNRGWDLFPAPPVEDNRLGWLQLEDGVEASEKWDECLRTGEAFDASLPLRHADGSQREYLIRIVATRDPSGVVQRWLGTGTDVDDLKNAVARERLLAAEVDHRAKNMLGVVQAVVQLSPAKEAEALKNSLLGRIQLLGRVQSLLSESGWRPVPIKLLLEEELAAFAPCAEQIVVDGPPLAAKPEALQALGLSIHELATNALQYGALSSPTGRVDVRWRQFSDEVVLTWRERGGPSLVKPPAEKGFGTTVIDRSVSGAMGGSATFDWEGEGLSCEIRVPSTFFQTVAETSQYRSKPSHSDNGEAVGPGRLLIVEDEPLIAMDLEEIFTGAGFEVVGTAGSVGEALDKIKTFQPEIVTLDLNLLGTRSYPVADYLLAEGIPFVFCTGYFGTERLPYRHKNVPILPKPVHPVEAVKTLRTLLRESRQRLRTTVDTAPIKPGMAGLVTCDLVTLIHPGFPRAAIVRVGSLRPQTQL